MRNIREHKARTQYLTLIRDHIINHIYLAKRKLQAQEIHQICMQNMSLIGEREAYSFVFEGKRYPENVRNISVNRKLHISLLEPMTSIIHALDYDEFEEGVNLHNYIGSLLQFAKNKDDLVEILPYPIHDALSAIEITSFDLAPSKPMDEILAFKEANPVGVECLNQLLVTRMLFAEV
jgi:hypothetical protein